MLQAFSGTQFVDPLLSEWTSVATLVPLAFRFCRRLSSAFLLVVMFLNDEGGRQQSLKGLLVESQVAPARGHGIVGEKASSNCRHCSANPANRKKKAKRDLGLDSRLRPPFWNRFMKAVQ